MTEKSDAEAYVTRLEKVSPLFDQVIEQMGKREEVGVYPPRWSYAQMIRASANVLVGQPFEESELNSAIWEDFLNKVASLNLPQAESDDLHSRAKIAILSSIAPAYKNLIAELEKQALLTPEGDGGYRKVKIGIKIGSIGLRRLH